MWLEAVSLEYILLELRLRLLLRTKQIGREIIDAKKYLVQLVDFEETHQFIDSSLAERIRDFNQIRKDAIHGLVQGRIEYKDVQLASRIYAGLTLSLQEAMGIRIEVGPEESYEEYLKKRNRTSKENDR